MDNQRRILAQVLAIDAWHEPMRFDGSSFRVHVELSFQKGRIGGDDPDFPFTFNIALKKALLTLKLESPLAIDRSTIARSAPVSQAELTSLISEKEAEKAGIGLNGKLSPKTVSLAANADVSQSASFLRETELKVSKSLPPIIAVPKPFGPTEYAWELSPGHGGILHGQPWDPQAEPRFSVRFMSAGKPRIEPIVKAIVSCSLEDIEITNLELKDVGALSLLKEMAFNRVNHAAAVQQLKLILMDLQLEVGALGDRFSKMFVAEVIASENYR